MQREGAILMDKEMILEGARRNWYLLVALAALPFIAMATIGGDNGPTGESGGSVGATVADAATVQKRDFSGGPFKARTTSSDDALAAIAKYDAYVRDNPNGEDAARNLERMGNLYYSKVRNYEMAISKYELLILRHPDYPDIGQIYPNLAACYERTQQHNLARETYRRMLDFYPPDSQHFAFAEQKLAGNL